jgi:hypothetical protein
MQAAANCGGRRQITECPLRCGPRLPILFQMLTGKALDPGDVSELPVPPPHMFLIFTTLDLSISIALEHSAFPKENVDSKYCSLGYFQVMHSQPIKSPGAIRSHSSSSPSISSPLITFSTPKNTPEAFRRDVLDLSTNHMNVSVHERTLLFLAPALYLQYASGKTYVFPFPFICLIVLQRLTEFKI